MIGNNGWRRHGEARRRELLRQDKAEGGTSFFLNRKCNIQKYFHVADRVLAQFRQLYQNRSDLEEIYVMGHRLIAFFSVALPRHPRYRSVDPVISALRDKSLYDLDWIRKRLEVIALRIDEHQLNQFIVNEAQKKNTSHVTDQIRDPDVPRDVSFETSFDSTEQERNNKDWETFSGWSLKVSDESNERVQLKTSDVSFDSNEIETPVTIDDEVMHSDPGYILYLESDDESSKDSEGGAVVFSLQDDGVVDSSFLKAIASEEVQFETDSEAADSWAQGSDWSAVASQNSEDAEERAVLESIVNRVRGNSPQKWSLRKPALLGIPDQTMYPIQQSTAAGLFSSNLSGDENSHAISPQSSSSSEHLLGIRNFPSPGSRQTLFPSGSSEDADSRGATFEMQGITPSRRLGFDKKENQGSCDQRLVGDTYPDHVLESSFADITMDSDYDEDIFIDSTGAVAVDPGRYLYSAQSRNS